MPGREATEAGRRRDIDESNIPMPLLDRRLIDQWNCLSYDSDVPHCENGARISLTNGPRGRTCTPILFILCPAVYLLRKRDFGADRREMSRHNAICHVTMREVRGNSAKAQEAGICMHAAQTRLVSIVCVDVGQVRRAAASQRSPARAPA